MPMMPAVIRKLSVPRLGVTLLPITFETVRNSIQRSMGQIQAHDQARKEITSSYKIDEADENALNAGINLHMCLKKMALE